MSYGETVWTHADPWLDNPDELMALRRGHARRHSWRGFAAGEPTYRQDNAVTAGDIPAPLLSDVPYGPTYEPVQDWFTQYKWWIVGGGVGLFLLAGGSILGLSLRKKRKMGSHRRRR